MQVATVVLALQGGGMFGTFFFLYCKLVGLGIFQEGS